MSAYSILKKKIPSWGANFKKAIRGALFDLKMRHVCGIYSQQA